MSTGRNTLHTHFDQHLNLRKILLDKKPGVIVECGAGNGDNTKLLAHMMQFYPLELHVISDKMVEGLDPRIKWTVGLSYKELAKFPDNSIDMCIIDTDHNYWTLMKELSALDPKLKEGGLIIFHDVDEFYHNTGLALSYWNDEPYPKDEILSYAKYGGVGDALLSFLTKYNSKYKLLYWTDKNYGAAMVEKKTVKDAMVIMPGTNPVFAKKTPEEVISI